MRCSVQSRALVICLALVAGFSVLSVRLIHLQWLDRSEMERRAARSYTRKSVLPFTRGVIVDANEEIIARDFPVTSIMVDMYHMRDPKLGALGVAYSELSRHSAWGLLTPEEQKRKLMARRRALLDSPESQKLAHEFARDR